MAKKAKKPTPEFPPFPTSLQTVDRLGLKPGDVLASSFPGWKNVLFRLNRLEEGCVWVDRLNRAPSGKWRVALTHKLLYMPPDVKRVAST
jgi:hypothetical protein